MAARTIVYSGLGSELEVFDCDPATGALHRLQSLQFSCVIQYGWPNRRRTILYIATSDAGPMAKIKGPNHFVQAFSILQDGGLAPLAPAVRLRNRPLHLSLDVAEQHLLIAYNDPPDVTVHRIEADGSISNEVPQPPLAFGPTVHQVMVTPPGTIAVVPACAHSQDGVPAGSVGIFRYSDGLLSPLDRIEARPERAAPWRGVRNGAQGFAARHVDFHPTRPWMYLCVEAQGELHLYDYDVAGVAREPRFVRSTLSGAPVGRSSQLASAVHVHPSGRFVYVSNRAWDTEPFDGHDVFVGGVNDVAVFAIDRDTGEPTLIQHVESQGIFPRTFGIDASGTVLVVGNQEPMMVRDGAGLCKVLPSLVLFRIGPDGRLTFLRRREHPDNGEVCFWVDVLTLNRKPS